MPLRSSSSRSSSTADFTTRCAGARRRPRNVVNQRLLACGNYLSLLLLGLLNPVVKTMRGLCKASRLQRVQQEVSLGVLTQITRNGSSRRDPLQQRQIQHGLAIQIYLALIAALLLQLYTGQRPNRRMMELIQFYLQGMATLEELWAGLERQRQQLARRKKS